MRMFISILVLSILFLKIYFFERTVSKSVKEFSEK